MLATCLLIHLRKKKQSEPANEEKQEGKIDFDILEKRLLIEHESAYLHQRIVIRRSTAENRLTLGEILQKLFPQMDESLLLTMAVAFRSGGVVSGSNKRVGN